MIRFKNHNNGFTLIEALLAMAVAALVLTPIYVLNGVVLQNVARVSRTYHRILLGEQFLYESRQKHQPETREYSSEKKIDDPETSIKYNLEKGMDKKSSLATVKGLQKEVVTMSWQDVGQPKCVEQLVSFVYKKPPEQKTKK